MLRKVIESDVIEDIAEEPVLQVVSTLVLYVLWMGVSVFLDTVTTGVPTWLWASLWAIAPLILGIFGPRTLYAKSWSNQLGSGGAETMFRYRALSREDRALFGPNPFDNLKRAYDVGNYNVNYSYSSLLDSLEEKNRVKKEALAIHPDFDYVIDEIDDRKKAVKIETGVYRELS